MPRCYYSDCSLPQHCTIFATNIAQATHYREIANMVSLQVLNFHACRLWQFAEICLNHWQDGMVMILRGY